MRSVVLLYVASILVCVGIGLSADGDTPTWNVVGTWSETCPCRSFCPCWFGNKPTFNHCENIQVFRIDQGRYGATSLSGITVVVVWVTPPGETMHAAAGHSRLLALYLDPSTQPAQRRAVESIWRNRILSGIQAPAGRLTIAPIQATFTPDHARVLINGVLRYEVVRGTRPVAIKHPVMNNFHSGHSVQVRYSDFGEQWSYAGTHAAFAEFRAAK